LSLKKEKSSAKRGGLAKKQIEKIPKAVRKNYAKEGTEKSK